MKKLNIQVAGFLDNSTVNGPGMRSVLFVSGCDFHCEGCHNEPMQDKNYGDLITTDDVMERIKKNIPLIDGVTISGGEPTLQIEAVSEIIKECKKLGLSVWMYTGNIYEELVKKDFIKVFGDIDVIVDGRFMKEFANKVVLYRGSSNQRLIDVKKTFENEDCEIILWNEEEDF